MPRTLKGTKKSPNSFLSIFMPLLIILITIGLLIYIYSLTPQGDFRDLSYMYDSIITFIGNWIILGLILCIIAYLFRNQITSLILIFLNVFGLVNRCKFCKILRKDNEPFLVNGSCAHCGLHICKKCFIFAKNKRILTEDNHKSQSRNKSNQFSLPEGNILAMNDKISSKKGSQPNRHLSNSVMTTGCPECGGIIFKPKKRLGFYLYVPFWLKRSMKYLFHQLPTRLKQYSSGLLPNRFKKTSNYSTISSQDEDASNERN